MSTQTVIIFPETTIDPASVQALLAHFGRVILCRPWYMGPFETGEGDDSSLEIIRPSEETKPEQDLKRVVAEYQTWMKQNPGRGYGISLNANHTEDASWDIRKAVRLMGEPSHAKGESPALKWHLILHLANSAEQNQSEADEMLRQMRASGSPLKEVIEAPGDLPDPLKDIPMSGTPLWVNDHQIRQVFEAWLGLFATQLPGDGALVTRHSQVFDYAVGVFEKAGQGEPLSGTVPRPAPTDLLEAGLTCQIFPVVRESDPQGRDPIVRGLSGKTLILIAY